MSSSISSPNVALNQNSIHVDGSTSDGDLFASPVPTEADIPSLIFAIPFPRPTQGYQTTKDTPPFLLYTFPRSVYEKPPKDPVTGKRKEKLLKKVERKWQEEVKEGEEIKRGEIKDAGMWSRFKGAVARDAAAAIKYLPNNAIEVLGRLPPKTKLGKLIVVYPVSTMTSTGVEVAQLEESEMEEIFLNFIEKARKKARTQTLVSGCLLPVTLAIDAVVVVPLCLFEINLAYFAVQASGSQKAKLLKDLEKKKTSKESTDLSRVFPDHGPRKTESTEDLTERSEGQVPEAMGDPFNFEVAQPETFDRTIDHLYNICFNLDPLKFPLKDSLPIPTYLPNKEIAAALLEIFRKSLPPEVMTRHVLDEQRAAEDLDRAMRKAAKEYVNTIKSINETSSSPAFGFLAPK